MIALCSDQAAYTLKHAVMQYLDARGEAYVDLGNYDMEVTYFSYFVDKTCRFMLTGKAKRAIIFCGSGIGIGLAANKYPGIRCGRCDDPTQVALGRQQTDMNVLAIGARITGSTLAIEMVETFLDTPFDPAYQASLDSLRAADQRYFKEAYIGLI
nr:RpiB/LacA/LacB family sugar-phosphate isomerase [Maliibacterium massiliense]